MDKKYKVIQYLITFLIHSIFWVIIYFFYAYFLGYGSTNTKYVNLFSGFLMPVTIFISYFLIYYLIPNYLFTKKYKLFILYNIYTFIISVYLINLSILYGLVYSEGLMHKSTVPLTKTLPLIILGVFFVVTIVVSLNLIIYSYKSIVKNESLKSKILETQLQLKEQELKFLKMQIHPHFLFNTLNTIYGFALKQSKDTPEIILKLSNLLDYILYQVNKPKVSLKEEVTHIKEYIALEKIRFQDTLKVSFKANDISEEKQIAPMLLIPFVENAFKHGNLIEGFLKVEIVIALDDDKLDFQIKNTVLTNDELEGNKGIGLENIKKRLNLLYANNYKLDIEKNDNWFTVNLTIYNLNEINNG
ncbi:histidine kinase [Lutibacter sp. B1]|nr:histidine kinase [Lutibacter sp. B1]